MKKSVDKLVKNIKPIINGYYYSRSYKNSNYDFKGGYINPSNNYCEHIDNNSMIKSGIIMIKI